MSSVRALLRPVYEISPRARPFPQSSVGRIQARHVSNDPTVAEVPPEANGPNQSQLPHVTEERAEMDKVMGETPPDIGQGTPVQEILKRNKQAKDSAPEVMKEQFSGQQKRSYSTSTRRLQSPSSQSRTEQELATDKSEAVAEVVSTGPQPQASSTDGASTPITRRGMIRGIEYPDAGPGHKFAIPPIDSVSRLDHLRRRYDPVVDQVTKSLMRDGKLSQAQKVMSAILDTLRTAPPPQMNPQFPQRTLMLSDGPPPMAQASLGPSGSAPVPATQSSDKLTYLPRSVLPLHPIAYLTTIIDSVAPLIKIRQQRGAAGGGASLPIPVPLGIRQRRRQAIQWILGAADGRRETKLADRVARELLNVAEGKSGVWERRALVHRLAVSSRSNVRPGRSFGRRRKIK